MWTIASCRRLSAAVMVFAIATTGARLWASDSAPMESEQGLRNGITVHGHWTIEVTNADGTPAARYEFENDLFDTRGLTFTLGRRNVVGRWSVLVGGIPSPCAEGGSNWTCVLSEPGTTQWSVGPHGPLTISVIGTQAREQLQLNGTFTAVGAGELSSVQTSIDLCPATGSPSAPCDFAQRFGFTRTFLLPGSSRPPIPVVAGQIVQVTVVISFVTES